MKSLLGRSVILEALVLHRKFIANSALSKTCNVIVSMSNSRKQRKTVTIRNRQ